VKHMSNLGPTFRAGDVCEVRMSAEGLAAGRDPAYPLRDYHGKAVVVIPQKEKRDGKIVVVRDTYPDDEVLVDVLLPFSFVPHKGAREVSTLPILACVLHQTGERLGKQKPTA